MDYFLSYTIGFPDWIQIYNQRSYKPIFKKNINKNRKRVAIYGADYLGFQLSNILQTQGKYNVICFLENSSSFYGSSINSIPIKNISKFNNKIENIEEVLITSENISLNKFKRLESQGIKVLYLSPFQYFRDKNNIERE